MAKTSEHNLTTRSPIVAVMGHIDHGKSTLLDYIRKTNTTDREAGGITQHLGAYEAVCETASGEKKTITFLDTPGHEAFSKIRSRGAQVADIVILVVAAEDGVNVQTKEALKTIEQSKTPYIVAINKIDKPNANVEAVKLDLASNNVYLEGFGGSVPFVPISAKTGVGVPELLDTILIMADMAELKKDDSKNAEGFVLETKLDARKGASGTILIMDGRLEKGMFVVIEDAVTPVRTVENYRGEAIGSASAPSPVRLIGFTKLPPVGAKFVSTDNKKEAERIAEEYKKSPAAKIDESKYENARVVVPVVLKADVAGSLEAIEKELLKIETAEAKIRFVHKGVGNITENDINSAGGSTNTLIIGFNVKADGAAIDLADRLGFKLQIFNIIYEISPIIKKEMELRTPKIEVEESIGKSKILKVFSKTKDKQIVGGLVLEGVMSLGKKCKIMRRDVEIGRGEVAELQQQKVRVKEVVKGVQFGSMIESKMTIAEGDTIEVYDLVQK